MNRTAANSELFKKVRTSHSFSNLLKMYGLSTKSVLDIGCSEGHYLQCFGEGSVGVTIIPEDVEAGKQKGLQIVLGNIEDPTFSLSQKFDVVWANNLFEHLNSPHPFLMRVKEFLKSEGMLILGVPVIPSLSWLTRFKKFRGAFAVSHVNFFTRRTIRETVRFAGWEVEEARLFRFKNPLLDSLLNFITPHVYVIARPKQDFKYAHKRLLSLEGYNSN